MATILQTLKELVLKKDLTKFENHLQVNYLA